MRASLGLTMPITTKFKIGGAVRAMNSALHAALTAQRVIVAATDRGHLGHHFIK